MSAKTQPNLDGAILIMQERERQISKEGWTPEHDDQHRLCELARAAREYARPYINGSTPEQPGWPFRGGWKPSDDRIKNLVKAGALIAAEIDRLLRLGAQRPAPEERRECLNCGDRGLIETVCKECDDILEKEGRRHALWKPCSPLPKPEPTVKESLTVEQRLERLEQWANRHADMDHVRAEGLNP